MKVAIYIRVSTEDQAKEGYSFEVQREYLESFAQRESYGIFNFYCDDGISAYSTRRPALKELLVLLHNMFSCIEIMEGQI